MQDSRINSANIAYDDMREWLAIAERMGEVEHVKGATWQQDIGLAAEALLRHEHGPCVVFDEVPGCPKGFRLLLNVFAGKRRNVTLGLLDHLSKWEMSDGYWPESQSDAVIRRATLIGTPKQQQAIRRWTRGCSRA